MLLIAVDFVHTVLGDGYKAVLIDGVISEDNLAEAARQIVSTFEEGGYNISWQKAEALAFCLSELSHLGIDEYDSDKSAIILE